MVPIAILIGLVIGRWWAMAAAATLWAVLLIATTTIGVGEAFTSGSALAAVNAAIGIGAHNAFASLIRSVRTSN